MTDQHLAFASHDHSACSGGVMAEAEAQCSAKGLRLTPVRRRTLEILAEAHRAMGAYEVLERLSKDGFGSQPPVAYRALEFLVENGLAHRIRRLNAFTACTHSAAPHSPAFFICRECDAVAEAPAGEIRETLDGAASKIGFVVERVNLEMLGLCPSCASA